MCGDKRSLYMGMISWQSDERKQEQNDHTLIIHQFVISKCCGSRTNYKMIINKSYYTKIPLKLSISYSTRFVKVDVYISKIFYTLMCSD